MSPALLRDPEAPSIQAFARLAPGAALETARADVDAISRRLEAEHDWKGLLTLDVSFPRDRYPEPSHRDAALQSLIERLEAVPAVGSVGVAGWTLMTGTASRAQMTTEDLGGTPRERSRWPLVLGVSRGFFPAAGIPLVAGRGFQQPEPGDSPSSIDGWRSARGPAAMPWGAGSSSEA